MTLVWRLAPVQVLIAWAIRRGTTVIPKSVSAHRLRENFESLRLVSLLTDADMAALAALERTDGSGRLNKGFSFLAEGQSWQSFWDEDWVEA